MQGHSPQAIISKLGGGPSLGTKPVSPWPLMFQPPEINIYFLAAQPAVFRCVTTLNEHM